MMCPALPFLIVCVSVDKRCEVYDVVSVKTNVYQLSIQFSSMLSLNQMLQDCGKCMFAPRIQVLECETIKTERPEKNSWEALSGDFKDLYQQKLSG